MGLFAGGEARCAARAFGSGEMGPIRRVTQGTSVRDSFDVAVSGETSVVVGRPKDTVTSGYLPGGRDGDGVPLGAPITIRSAATEETGASVSVQGNDIAVTWVTDGNQVSCDAIQGFQSPKPGL